jgi:hypothetical protein
VHVTEDPDKSWHQLTPHMLHVAREYAKYAEEAGWKESPFAGVDTLEKLKASGLFHVVTPDECLKLVETADKVGGDMGLMPLLGGLDPKIGWESIELFVKKVMPRVKRTS